MKVASILPYRWRSRRDAARHAEAIAAILETPPIQPRKDGLVLFSMIGTAVVLPYLVALKSLWHELRRGRVALLDDGTLTAQDRAILAHHCGDPELLRLADVRVEGFPTGGCWERLLTILDRRGGEYWLQLDSDTVTLGPVPEVAQAIAMNRSFTLLGDGDAEHGVEPLGDFARRVYPQGPQGGHIQTVMESRLGLMAPGRDWRYVRGCAGFAGFAAGGPGRGLAAAFIRLLSPTLEKGGQLADWGSEQVASNFIIANEPAPVLLPYDRYLNYWGQPMADDAAFVHFIGTHRHTGGTYAETSRRAIDRLLQG
ncbi:conserved hypothetical protein [Altererythrobacter sp. B11]|uniref:hypothetical protein n=1 Tax=Altererythrobacter sp. B11 TaxID=2060312 RepID=UPI000DC6E240|nr:hypothetical protein [Altererythrobacter sp. B11]BBC74427.1 conserved hypothetical protein [Altererythrobacter sp. B11]